MGEGLLCLHATVVCMYQLATGVKYGRLLNPQYTLVSFSGLFERNGTTSSWETALAHSLRSFRSGV